MGGGTYSWDARTTRLDNKTATGTPVFDYDATTRTKPTGTWKAHDSLDPKKMHECRDSVEHPQSLATQIWLDVTGSMSAVVKQIHGSFPQLQGVVLRRGYAPDNQYGMCAIGDVTSDRVPVQFGEFESDNRIDITLENMFLEGGGGGSNHESYELALFAAARRTSIDCFEKRGQKGYLFIVGDELAYSVVSRKAVLEQFGVTIQADIPLRTILAEAQEKYHVYFILPVGASNGGSPVILQFWRDLLGQNVYELETPEGICELIASIIGITEGIVDPEDALDDLAKEGVDSARIAAVSRSLATTTGHAVGRATGGMVTDLGNDASGAKKI